MIEKLNVTKKIRVPLDAVWSAISNIDNLDRWFSAIKHCHVEGQGVGAIRTLTLSEGGIIRDIIEEVDFEKHQLCYKCITLPFPVSNYQGAVNLSSTSEGETDLSWSAKYQVSNENQQEMRTLILSILNDGINGIEQDLQKL